MSIEIEDISNVEKKVTVTIRQEIVADELNSNYRNLGKKVKIKGFRQGKVPIGILKRYHKEQVEGEVISKLVNNSCFKAFEENNIIPVSQPVIDNGELEEGKDFTYSAKVEVKPVIDVKGYTGMKLQKEKVGISKEDVDNNLAKLQQENAQLQEMDEPRPARQGDFVILDYEGFYNGEPIDGVKVTDHSLELGSGVFPKEFEEQLIGLQKGDAKEIESTLSERYGIKDLVGKEVVFKVEVKGIKEKIIPEINDDFAKDLGECDTLDELRKKIEDDLKKKSAIMAEARVREKALDKLVEENIFDLPSSLLDQHLQYMIADVEMKLAFQGLDLEKINVTADKLKEDYRDKAEKEVRASLLLEAIADRESIQVEEKELEDKITEIAERSSQEIEKIRTHYKETSARERLRNGLVTEKTIDFIIEKAEMEDVERGKDDADPNSD